MRSKYLAKLAASALLALLLLAGHADSASAQQRVMLRRPLVPSRFSLGADGVMSQPKGDFANNIGTGWGGNVFGLFRLDRRGYVQLRVDGGMVQYGRETKRIPLNPITGRVSLKVVTNNLIGWGGIGGQLQIPDGPFRPYVNGSIAYTDFSTHSSLEGTDGNSDGLSSTNQHDGSHAWVTGAGVTIPFGRSFTRGNLDFGARYYQGGTAAYLKKGDIIDNPDGSISFTPRRSKTDMVVWHLGASFTLPR